MGGAVLQQEGADGLGGRERLLEAVQQHVRVDELGAAWLTGEHLEQEGLQRGAGAGQQQGAHAMEMGLGQRQVGVLRRVRGALFEDLKRCETVHTELSWMVTVTRGDEAPVGEEQ